MAKREYEPGRFIRLDLKPAGVDFKSYLEEQAKKEEMSVTKYIHKLIEKDMICKGADPLPLDSASSRFSRLSVANQQLILDIMLAMSESKKQPEKD